MTVKRILQRICFYPIKGIIVCTEMVSTKIYMNMLNKLLKNFGVNINKAKYIHKTVKFDDFDRITIEDDVVISFGVYFLTHDYSRLVSYDLLRSKGMKIDNHRDNPYIGKIKIGENTFIGCRCLILPNSTIGKNCIIGAGSVIKGVIPDNSVVIGNPGKVVGSVESFGHKWLKQYQNKDVVS